MVDLPLHWAVLINNTSANTITPSLGRELWSQAQIQRIAIILQTEQYMGIGVIYLWHHARDAVRVGSDKPLNYCQ